MDVEAVGRDRDDKSCTTYLLREAFLKGGSREDVERWWGDGREMAGRW